MFKKGDPVAYKMWDFHKHNWYELTGVITEYYTQGNGIVILFDEEQKEFTCQESRIRLLPAIPTKENSCNRLSE